jgi:hypothetical protein
VKLADLRKRFRPEPKPESQEEARKRWLVELRDEAGRSYKPTDPAMPVGGFKTYTDLKITLHCGVCRAEVGTDMHCQACEDRSILLETHYE